jgi:hypothetical protein
MGATECRACMPLLSVAIFRRFIRDVSLKTLQALIVAASPGIQALRAPLLFHHRSKSSTRYMSDVRQGDTTSWDFFLIDARKYALVLGIY